MTTAPLTEQMKALADETSELFLVTLTGDGASARLIEGRVQMAAYVRGLIVGSDNLEDISEAGATDHLRILLDAGDAEWLEYGEPASYRMEFEDGSITVHLVTEEALRAHAAAREAAPDVREAEPVAWLYERPASHTPPYQTARLEFATCRWDERTKAPGQGWTETPLYDPAAISAAERKATERAFRGTEEIVRDLMASLQLSRPATSYAPDLPQLQDKSRASIKRAEEWLRLRALSDPAPTQGGPARVEDDEGERAPCPHGIRWPWPCDQCDEAAWPSGEPRPAPAETGRR